MREELYRGRQDGRRARRETLLATTLAISLSLAASVRSQAPAAAPPDRTYPIALLRVHASPWLPRRAVVARLGFDTGDSISVARFTDGMARLVAWRRVRTARFEEAVAADGGVTLDLYVEAYGQVHSVRFDGIRSASPARLRELAALHPGELLRQNRLEEARESIQRFYHERGYLFAEVRASSSPVGGQPGGFEVVFEVHEGKRFHVEAIRFEGSTVFAEHELRAVLRQQPRRLVGLLSRGHFLPHEWRQDLDRIEALYRERGYLDVSVTPMDLDVDLREGTVELGVRVQEGVRFELEAVEFEGHNDALERGLRMQLRAPVGTWYDGRALRADLERLYQFYMERIERMPSIEVDHEFDPGASPPRARVIFRIDEREHLFAGKIGVTGNTYTLDRVVRGALRTAPTDPLTARTLESIGDRVNALGYFERATVTTTPAPDRVSPFRPDDEVDLMANPENVRDVTIDVDEQPTGLFEIGGGASSGEGEVFSIRLSQRNLDIFDFPGGTRGWKRPFTGRGQKLDLIFLPGTKVSEFRLYFEEPYVYNTRHALTLEGSNRLFDWREFDEIHSGGRIGLRRQWNDAGTVFSRALWNLRDVNLDDLEPNVPQEIRQFDGHVLLSYPSLELTYTNRTPNPFSGPTGLHLQARGDLSLEELGSEASFTRVLVEGDFGLPVTPWINAALPGEPFAADVDDLAHKLHLGARFGWMEGTQGDDVPFYERFMLGGPRTFRGFGFRDVGPRVAGIPVGGEAFWSGTIAYSFPVYWPEIRLAALFDFGDIEPAFSDLAANRIRTAAGVGVLLRPKLFGQRFPVNLYFVEALRKERDDRDRVFTFALGLEF